jgi:transcriptional regulator with XRE-family HTH domain|tara:strand:+ start:9272 stop:10159 length:888 start_codon:yes stop_codon:yes gene_type:complete
MTSQFQMISEIGDRLKSYRLGTGLSPEDVAKNTGISVASIYRYEAGKPIRVDALGKIADLLDISLASLFGVGSENIASAVTFFERLRQIEAEADQITVLFGPVPYLLTSDSYDELLPQVLLESVPDIAANRGGLESSISQLIEILLSRKKAFKKRKPNIIALISALELEQFVRSGFVGSTNLNPNEIDIRRKAAVLEVQNVIYLLKEQPIGIQIGVVQDSMPGTSFQILRKGTNAQVATSPFRLGTSANVRIGVATITSAREAIKLHQSVTENLWKHSLKGEAAATALEKLLQEF